EGNSGNIGVLGSGFTGVMGTGTVGGYFSGTLAAISLEPQLTTGPPTSGDYYRGDMLVDASGVLYLCVADGNPGTWLSGGGTRFLSRPTRAYDSRDSGNKLGTAEPHGAGTLSAPRTVNVVSNLAG